MCSLRTAVYELRATHTCIAWWIQDALNPSTSSLETLVQWDQKHLIQKIKAMHPSSPCSDEWSRVALAKELLMVRAGRSEKTTTAELLE